MSVRVKKPGRGQIDQTSAIDFGPTSDLLGGRQDLLPPKPASKPGYWRPNVPFRNHRGLLIVMRREPNLTAKGVLHVPMRFEVPVRETFERPYQFSWTTYDTLTAGQKSTPYGPQLLTFTLQTMLLTDDAAWSAEDVVAWDGAHDPVLWLRELRRIMGYEQGSRPQVFRLIVRQPGVWERDVLNILATLTEIDPQQVPGEQGTEYTALTFLEWREGKVGQRRWQQAASAQTVKLKSADTLYELAKRFFHQSSSWRLIAGANGIKGVTPGSATELAAWAKKHHKTTLKIPAKPKK